jgi:hypothetical protein
VVSVTPRPLFTPGKDPVPIVQEAGWAAGGRTGQVRKIPPLPEFDPRTFQPVASRYTDYATRATLFFMLRHKRTDGRTAMISIQRILIPIS